MEETNNDRRKSSWWQNGWTTQNMDKKGVPKIISDHVAIAWESQQRVSTAQEQRVGMLEEGTLMRRKSNFFALEEPQLKKQLSFETGNRKVEFSNGDVYDGQWKNGQMHGRGQLRRKADGTVYDGQWEHSKRCGFGALYYADGAKKFEGEWKRNNKNGHGIYWEQSSGNTYEGQFKDGFFHGKGRYLFANGDRYEGNFVNDMFCGRGEMTSVQGDCYHGEWLDGKYHGHGIMTYATKERYDGEFWQGQRHGKGKYKCSQFSYEGDWRSDCMHGNGKYTYSNGDYYEGEWVNDCECGTGKYVFCNGGWYQGEWRDGTRHGKGTYIYDPIAGEKYEGEWHSNLKHGNGKYFYGSGASYDGQWANDVAHGDGVYVYTTSKAYDVTFSHGTLVSKQPHEDMSTFNQRTRAPLSRRTSESRSQPLNMSARSDHRDSLNSMSSRGSHRRSMDFDIRGFHSDDENRRSSRDLSGSLSSVVTSNSGNGSVLGIRAKSPSVPLNGSMSMRAPRPKQHQRSRPRPALMTTDDDDEFTRAVRMGSPVLGTSVHSKIANDLETSFSQIPRTTTIRVKESKKESNNYNGPTSTSAALVRPHGVPALRDVKAPELDMSTIHQYLTPKATFRAAVRSIMYCLTKLPSSNGHKDSASEDNSLSASTKQSRGSIGGSGGSGSGSGSVGVGGLPGLSHPLNDLDFSASPKTSQNPKVAATELEDDEDEEEMMEAPPPSTLRSSKNLRATVSPQPPPINMPEDEDEIVNAPVAAAGGGSEPTNHQSLVTPHDMVIKPGGSSSSNNNITNTNKTSSPLHPDPSFDKHIRWKGKPALVSVSP